MRLLRCCFSLQNCSGGLSLSWCESWQERYSNRPIEELQNAASEQQKITELRLAKLMSNDANSNAFLPLHFFL
jgi:hypothetical protein